MLSLKITLEMSVKELLAQLEATEVEPDGDDSELIKRLNHLADTGVKI